MGGGPEAGKRPPSGPPGWCPLLADETPRSVQWEGVGAAVALGGLVEQDEEERPRLGVDAV